MSRTDDKDPARFDDMLSRYLKGQFSEAEEAEFRQLVADDAELRNRAIATARLAKAMGDAGRERDRAAIRAIGQASEEEVRAAAAGACGATERKRRARGLRWILVPLSVAASILLCVFGGYRYYTYRQVTSLGTEYLACFPASEFQRGENDSINSELERLYADIEKKRNLDTAISRLSEMWRESRADTYNAYTEHMPEIGWMLANACLCDNDREKAVSVLDILIADNPTGTALGDKARELKARIEGA